MSDDEIIPGLMQVETSEEEDLENIRKACKKQEDVLHELMDNKDRFGSRSQMKFCKKRAEKE